METTGIEPVSATPSTELSTSVSGLLYFAFSDTSRQVSVRLFRYNPEVPKTLSGFSRNGDARERTAGRVQSDGAAAKQSYARVI